MSELRDYILSKASEVLLEFDARAVMAKISKGVTGQGSAEGWDKPKPQAPVKPKKPKPAKPTAKVESTILKDRMVEALTQKLIESSMEFTYGRETPEQKAKNAARLKQLRSKKAKKPSRESNPEAGGGEGTKPGSYFTNRHGGRTEN